MIEPVNELKQQLEAVMEAAVAGQPELPVYLDDEDQPDLALAQPASAR